MNIDWSKAPEWAEWVGATESGFVWAANSGYMFFNTNVLHKWGERRYSTEVHVIERKASGWSGEGLPPVGTECEYSLGGHPWFPCEVRYVLCNDPDPDADGWTAVIWCPHLEKEQVARVAPVGHFKFRQLRTPEQIAADERDKEMGEILAVMLGHNEGSIHMDTVQLLCAKRIHAAGYRKQEAP